MSWVRVPPDSHMKKYTVLKHFQWGKLLLEKGSIILITKQDEELATVFVEHYPDKSQVIGVKAIEGMMLLKNITAFE